ncbi:MAG: T9SS type A sorting domain-containing protein, partial [Bacteroidetes bacterium]|nr:T9SS type A sorting domain-containing protein [Bacteroidota bacterium]
RLVFTSPKTFLSIRPFDNSNNTVDISFRTNEYGTTHIDLYNSLGIKVNSIVNDMLDLGEHERQLSLEKLSTGIYFLVMSTPTERFTEQVRVIR